MGVYVTFQVELGEELPRALVALESLNTLMDFHVLIKVSSLSESEVTTLLAAFKWTLASVYSQVVKEVVPFFEGFVTSGMGAKKLFNDALGTRVFELED
jgi:hypothetical protein